MSLKTRDIFLGIIVIIAAYGITTIITPKIFFWKGMNLYNNKNYSAAIGYIKKALILRPDNTDYRFYFVKSLSELKPTYEVQKIMYKFATNKKDDGATILANEKIAEWKRNIHENIGNNYIEQTPSDSHIIRWNKNSFPLKVYIDTMNSVPDYYKSAISRALNQWDKSVDFVAFTLAEKQSDAQISILFAPIPENVCDNDSKICKFVVGYTTPKTTGRKLQKMTITIYDKNPRGEYFSDKEIYNTVLHELGHALGIMGHSYSTDDLMYMSSRETQDKIFTRFRSSFQYLSAKDLNTLRLLYNMTPTITDTPLQEIDREGLIYAPVVLGSAEEIGNQKLKEAENYIKNAPDLPGGYIDLAVAYAQLGKLRKATENLDTALQLAKTDQDKYVIYYNYAVVYLNNNKPDSALKYAQTAQRIKNSEEILDLISNIEHAISTKQKPFKDNFLTE